MHKSKRPRRNARHGTVCEQWSSENPSLFDEAVMLDIYRQAEQNPVSVSAYTQSTVRAVATSTKPAQRPDVMACDQIPVRQRAEGSHAGNLRRIYDDFALDNRSRGLAPKTLGFYDQQLEPFFRWLERRGISDVSQIDATSVRSYLAERHQAGVKPSTVGAAHRAIRRFLCFCVENEVIATSVMTNVKPPKQDRRILPAIELADIERMLAVTTCARDRAAIILLFSTGLRASEFINLTGDNIDFEDQSIHVVLGKGGKDRYVFFDDATADALRDYFAWRGWPDKDSPIWLSETTGKPLTQDGLNQMLKRVGVKAGVVTCNPHAFRRAFAKSCLQNRLDLHRLSRLMGHADTAVTERYLPLTNEDLRAAYREHGPSCAGANRNLSMRRN